MRKPKLKLNLKLLFNLTQGLRRGLRLIIFIIIIFLAIIFVTGHLLRILKDSDYFKTKDIITYGTDSVDLSSVDLSYLKGRNIFLVDLQKESGYISQLYPTYKKVRLIRILPNRLFIDFLKRTPLGIVKLYRYFCVDDESVLFNLPYDKLKELNLPLILGLETKIFGPKSGKKYNVRELALALNIIKEIEANKALKDYKIKKIDVANPAHASFFINEGELEIKINEEDIKDKVNILSNLLIQLKKDLANIRYIDLRFKEPVIKLKDVK